MRALIVITLLGALALTLFGGAVAKEGYKTSLEIRHAIFQNF